MEFTQSKFEEDRAKLVELEANRDVFRKKLMEHIASEKETREDFDAQVKVLAAAKIKLDGLMHFGMKKIKAKLSGSYKEKYEDYSREETDAQLKMDEIKYKLTEERKAIKEYNREYEKAVRDYDAHCLYIKKMYPDEAVFVTERKERSKDAFSMIKEIDEAVAIIKILINHCDEGIEEATKLSGRGITAMIRNSASMLDTTAHPFGALNDKTALVKVAHTRVIKEVEDVNNAYLNFASKYGSSRELVITIPDDIERYCCDSYGAETIANQLKALKSRNEAIKEKLVADKKEIMRFES